MKIVYPSVYPHGPSSTLVNWFGSELIVVWMKSLIYVLKVFLYGPAALPLAVSDCGNITSTLLAVKELNTRVLMSRDHGHPTTDVTSFTDVQGSRRAC